MVENPNADHCLRLASVCVTFSSLSLAIYTFFLTGDRIGIGKGFFSFFVVIGFASSVTSILAYVYKGHRLSLFYTSVILILTAFIAVVLIFYAYYFKP